MNRRVGTKSDNTLWQDSGSPKGIGRTGNAAKTPAHVHYTIVTPVPHFWLYNRVYGNGNQPKKFNWMKMFYLNPDDYLR